MTLRMQGLLLRFLETGELQKVGADAAGGRVNVRVVAATNRDLRELIGLGTVPRGPVLPPERHPPRRAAAARTEGRHPGDDLALAEIVLDPRRLHRALDRRRRAGGAQRAPLAGQRARARERHRAARRHLPQGRSDARRFCRTRSAAATRARSGRAANGAARLPTISTSASSEDRNRSDRRLSALHAARNHAIECPSDPGRQAGLQEARAIHKDRRATVQPGIARLQEVPQLSCGSIECQLPSANTAKRHAQQASSKTHTFAIASSPLRWLWPANASLAPRTANRARRDRKTAALADAAARAATVTPAANYIIGPDDVLSVVFWRDKRHVRRRRRAAGREDLAAADERRAGRRPDAEPAP